MDVLTSTDHQKIILMKPKKLIKEQYTVRVPTFLLS